MAAITAGLDLLYRGSNRNAGILDAEGLIPVAVAEVEPRTFNSYEEAEVALLSLRDRLSQAETALRRDWLDEMSRLDACTDCHLPRRSHHVRRETGAANSRRCPRDTRRDHPGVITKAFARRWTNWASEAETFWRILHVGRNMPGYRKTRYSTCLQTFSGRRVTDAAGSRTY